MTRVSQNVDEEWPASFYLHLFELRGQALSISGLQIDVADSQFRSIPLVAKAVALGDSVKEIKVDVITVWSYISFFFESERKRKGAEERRTKRWDVTFCLFLPLVSAFLNLIVFL